MWLGDHTADQTASVSAAGHKPDQGAYPLHYAAHVRASDRADVGRHSGSCLWGRVGWQHVPNDRPCCAAEREQRIELTLSLPQLAVDYVQTRDQRAHVDACRFSNAISDLDGRFSQCTNNGLGIDAADAMLL